MYGKWSHFVFLSGCLLFPRQCTSSSDAPVWQEHQDVACKKKKGDILTPSFGHLSANHKLSTGNFCFSLHGVISQDCVSTNISLYCLWTKKIFVIFSAFFCVHYICFWMGAKTNVYKVYIFAIRPHLFWFWCISCIVLALLDMYLFKNQPWSLCYYCRLFL